MKKNNFKNIYLILLSSLIVASILILPVSAETSEVKTMAHSLGLVADYDVNVSETISIPFVIQNVNNGPIQTMSLQVNYDENVVLLESMGTQTLTSGWINKIGNDKHSVVLSTFYKNSAIANGTSGPVCVLNFKAIGNIGNSTTIYISNIDFASVANEHGTSSSANGTITIIDPLTYADVNAPDLTGVSPISGTKFDSDKTSVYVKFDYNDAWSGINESSIVFEFDDVKINESEGLEVTANYTAYNATGLTAGNYLASMEVADNAGNFATFTTSFTIASVSSGNSGNGGSGGGGGGSSGGGGGGGSTDEDFDNIHSKHAKVRNVVIGEVSSYEFDEEECDVSYIQFTGTTNSGQISALVEILEDTSTLVDSPAPGIVYRNLNIWVGNAAFGDDKIEDAVIGFSVSKEWLSENEIDSSNIALFHYSDGQWNELDTSQTEEDDEFVYFQASTPGFSPFAIAATTSEDTIASDDDKLESPADIEDESSQSKPVEEIPTESKSTPGLSFMSVIGMILVTSLIVRKKD
jgi:PGF-pre-PGF domain-containing protein